MLIPIMLNCSEIFTREALSLEITEVAQLPLPETMELLKLLPVEQSTNKNVIL